MSNAEKLQNLYSDDLDENFPTEVLHFKEYNVLNFGEFMENELHLTFPNVYVALRIFLSMAVTNCSAERSFSALKRIKNYLRANLSHEKLTFFALLAIENSITADLDFETLIKEFAEQKARKKTF